VSPGDWAGPLAYLAVFVATVIEGEVIFVAAATLVHMGRLDAAPVLISAALGGSVGDQIYFYALRGRLRGWLDRFPTLARRREGVVDRVRHHASAMILACRFLPGLRIAIPAACAYADVKPARFTALSLVSSLGWACAVMGFVAWLGPASFAELGIRAWWTPVVPAALVVGFTLWLRGAPARPTDAVPQSPARPVSRRRR
jgi:membrane protein DedA with SNARE-associated domain